MPVPVNERFTLVNQDHEILVVRNLTRVARVICRVEFLTTKSLSLSSSFRFRIKLVVTAKADHKTHTWMLSMKYKKWEEKL